MDKFLQTFARYVLDKKLNITAQRLAIAESFFKSEKHLTAEELYLVVKKFDPSIGQTTVYRTLKLLCDSGLAREIQLGNTSINYEKNYDTEHHDHLICESCGKIIEVTDQSIERLQNKLAEKHGFTLTTHVLNLYGLCKECHENREHILNNKKNFLKNAKNH